METIQIIKTLERIKRVKSNLTNENISDRKKDVLGDTIVKNGAAYSFLTSNIDIEKVLFEKYPLDKTDLENINSVLDDEMDIAFSIKEYVRKGNINLDVIIGRLKKFKTDLQNYNHTDSDMLLSLLYEDLSDSKLYFYNFDVFFNASVSKDYIEISTDSFNYTTDYNLTYDINNGYMKIVFPNKTFVNFINFKPILKTSDEYTILAEVENNQNVVLGSNEVVSKNTMIEIAKSCYSVTIKGSNISNILNGFRVMVGEEGALNSNKTAYAVMTFNLDTPNKAYKIISSDNKRCELFFVDKKFRIDPELLYEDAYSVVKENGIQVGFNTEYDYSLIDYKLVAFYDSNYTYYKAIKILKI